MRRVLRWSVLVLALALTAVLVVQLWFGAQVLYVARHDPPGTAFMRAHAARAAAGLAGPVQHRWVPYGHISAHLKRAVVAAEDAKFITHAGFDWEAIEQALEKNDARGRVVSGASTITQQLAKNLFLSGRRSWLRKGQEAVIAWMIERTMTKQRILELYLNVVEWGDGVFGAEAAAQHHFGVSAAALTPRQSAWLAVVLPSPRRYVRGATTPYIARRVATIEARMRIAQIP